MRRGGFQIVKRLFSEKADKIPHLTHCMVIVSYPERSGQGDSGPFAVISLPAEGAIADWWFAVAPNRKAI